MKEKTMGLALTLALETLPLVMNVITAAAKGATQEEIDALAEKVFGHFATASAKWDAAKAARTAAAGQQ